MVLLAFGVLSSAVDVVMEIMVLLDKRLPILVRVQPFILHNTIRTKHFA